MWLFTIPVLKLAIQIGIAFSSVFLIIQIVRWAWQSTTPNPFVQDERKPRRPYITDQKKRDQILKQPFKMEQVPQDLDAIIIGSGIGGMTTGAIMSKAGKRVLILEQHDQAGGCCHTFIDKGYEFDVGIHYIGKFGHHTINKTLMDQICEGQVEWNRLEDEFDIVSIGYEDKNRQYPVLTGFENWKKQLKKQFPDEENAIDKYFELVKEYTQASKAAAILKVIPLWISKIICKTPLLNLFLTKLWNDEKRKTTLEVVEELTSNKDLQTIFTYCWGDYGTIPSKSHFSMQAELIAHFQYGGFYPIGGASEIALNMIPVIERTGGRVLVKAEVKEIILSKGQKGVIVQKGQDRYRIEAPIVISSAGLYNTFERLLKPEISQKSYYSDICRQLKPGIAAMNVFLGFNASNEELNLKAHNIWAFPTNDSEKGFMEYLDLSVEEALDAKVPLMFVSFPSAKDPNWKSHPGRESKSTCAIVTLANWDWYKKWESKPLKRRGDDYDEIKNTVGEMLIEQTCQLFPQIRDHIEFKDIGSPVTNKTYLAQPHGEIYGLDHTLERFAPLMAAKLRPKTDIPGLFLTGQDVFSCGFTGALFGGLLCAGAVLERNVMTDLISIHNKVGEMDKKKKYE